MSLEGIRKLIKKQMRKWLGSCRRLNQMTSVVPFCSRNKWHLVFTNCLRPWTCDWYNHQSWQNTESWNQPYQPEEAVGVVFGHCYNEYSFCRMSEHTYDKGPMLALTTERLFALFPGFPDPSRTASNSQAQGRKRTSPPVSTVNEQNQPCSFPKGRERPLEKKEGNGGPGFSAFPLPSWQHVHSPSRWFYCFALIESHKTPGPCSFNAQQQHWVLSFHFPAQFSIN